MVENEYQTISNNDRIIPLYNKPAIELPTNNRLVTEFINDIAPILKRKDIIFYRRDLDCIVVIDEIVTKEEKRFLGFKVLSGNNFVSILEKFITPGFYMQDRENKSYKFIKRSCSISASNICLESNQLKENINPINRIFSCPIPVMYNNELTLPKKGYDERFNSWMNYNVPEINIKMSLEEAKKIIEVIYKEFCFGKPKDKTHAIAGLLTPFLRGLYSRFNVRTPLFFYMANKPGVGKDYCAGITSIIHEGEAIEDLPLATNGKVNNEEVLKRVVSALLFGRKRIHFANNKGLIDSAIIESILTAPKIHARILGKSEEKELENEMEFSLSGNIGVTYTPDLARRCRIVNMFYAEEDINSRKFENKDLHQNLLNNRGKVLSALYALVRNWNEKGRPNGSLEFSSFTEWANICGGIMESAGYNNPCAFDVDTTFQGDSESSQMKTLFEICFERYPNQWIAVHQVRDIAEENELFGELDFEKNSGKTSFGKKINKELNTIKSNIIMIAKDNGKQYSNKEVKFQNV